MSKVYHQNKYILPQKHREPLFIKIDDWDENLVWPHCTKATWHSIRALKWIPHGEVHYNKFLHKLAWQCSIKLFLDAHLSLELLEILFIWIWFNDDCFGIFSYHFPIIFRLVSCIWLILVPVFTYCIYKIMLKAKVKLMTLVVCRLLGSKPLPNPMMDGYEPIWSLNYSKIVIKTLLYNGDHFVSASLR